MSQKYATKLQDNAKIKGRFATISQGIAASALYGKRRAEAYATFSASGKPWRRESVADFREVATTSREYATPGAPFLLVSAERIHRAREG
jgi:hypothetical protein